MSLLSNAAQSVTRVINPSTIDSFKAMISDRGGLAKTNRFVVILQPPTQTLFNLDIESIASTIFSNQGLNYRDFITDPRDIALLCESSAIPAKSFNTAEFTRMGRNFKVPISQFENDIDMVFHLTNDYYIKKEFDKWQSLIIPVESPHVAYTPKYSVDITIQQLNEQNIPVYASKLIGAWPVDVNSVALDNSSDNSTQKLHVKFTFEKAIPAGEITSTVSGVLSTVGNLLTRLV